MEVEEIGATVVRRGVVSAVAVLGAEEGVVEPIGCRLKRVVVVRIGAGLGGRVVGQYGPQRVVGKSLVLLLLLVSEMVKREVVGEMVVSHITERERKTKGTKLMILLCYEFMAFGREVERREKGRWREREFGVAVYKLVGI